MANTTTLHAVIDRIVTDIKAISPVFASDVKFDRVRFTADFRAWAAKATSDVIRKFDIRREGSADFTGETDPSAVPRDETLVITIAYPVLPGRYRRGDTPDDGIDMDEVIRRDLRDIHDVVFSPDNYLPGHSLSQPSWGAPERDEKVWFQEISVRVLYLESMSL